MEIMLAGEYPMKKEDMKRMLFVLGKEHCLDVMINVYKNDWQTASEVARDLNIHIATAVKYLSELYELGLVNRRIKRGKTREAYEYQVKNPKVKIEFDISTLMVKSIRTEKKPMVLFAILYTILFKSRKVVGSSVDNFVDGKFEDLKNSEKQMVKNSLLFEGDLEDAKNYFIQNLNGTVQSEDRCKEVVDVLTELINVVVRHYESKLGQHSTESLVDVTMQKVIDTFGGEIILGSNMLSTLPYDYFGKWRA
jgi:predicted transcriptional regulator